MNIRDEWGLFGDPQGIDLLKEGEKNVYRKVKRFSFNRWDSRSLEDLEECDAFYVEKPIE